MLVTSTSSSFASSSSIIILSMRALCRSSRETAPIRASEKKQVLTKEGLKEEPITGGDKDIGEMIRRWCLRRWKGTNISQICLWQTSSTDSLISSQPLTTFPLFSSFSHKFVHNFSPTKLCSMAAISMALFEFVPHSTAKLCLGATYCTYYMTQWVDSYVHKRLPARSQ